MRYFNGYAFFLTNRMCNTRLTTIFMFFWREKTNVWTDMLANLVVEKNLTRKFYRKLFRKEKLKIAWEWDNTHYNKSKRWISNNGNNFQQDEVPVHFNQQLCWTLYMGNTLVHLAFSTSKIYNLPNFFFSISYIISVTLQEQLKSHM